jgi:hypothetical protein
MSEAVALSLKGGVLLSCSGSITRPVLFPRFEELHELALVLKEGPEGQVMHSW